MGDLPGCLCPSCSGLSWQGVATKPAAAPTCAHCLNAVEAAALRLGSKLLHPSCVGPYLHGNSLDAEAHR